MSEIGKNILRSKKGSESYNGNIYSSLIYILLPSSGLLEVVFFAVE